MFVCLFIYFCLFFIIIILGYPQEFILKISWRSEMIWLRYIESNFFYLFIRLFVCLKSCLFFCFSHPGTPTESSPEKFVKIWLDLGEILRIRKLDWKMFICLFVCLFAYKFVCFFVLSLWNTHRMRGRVACGQSPCKNTSLQRIIKWQGRGSLQPKSI